MQKLAPRYFSFVFSTIMAIFMSFLMSGIITAANIGFPADFLTQWMQAWGFAFAAAWPILQVVAPMARRLTLRFCEAPLPPARPQAKPAE